MRCAGVRADTDSRLAGRLQPPGEVQAGRAHRRLSCCRGLAITLLVLPPARARPQRLPFLCTLALPQLLRGRGRTGKVKHVCWVTQCFSLFCSTVETFRTLFFSFSLNPLKSPSCFLHAQSVKTLTSDMQEIWSLIPGSGRSPEMNGTAQCACLEKIP